MATFKGQIVSIVFIGKQNPLILNHDFLINHGILPKDREPFKSLFTKKEQQPFSEYFSSPVITSIKYDNISIIVEDNRYQIVDSKFEDTPSDTIFLITKKYFGELLKYTPLQVGGINLNGIISFSGKDEEIEFDQKIGVVREALYKLTGVKEVRVGLLFNFLWKNGFVEVQFSAVKGEQIAKAINFNYEFSYADIDSFIKNLDDFGGIYGKFNEILKFLGISITK